MANISVDNIKISNSSRCYVIAEIGNNHMGSLENSFKLVEAAKRAGANAVKFQKRDNKVLFSKKLYNTPYENSNSFGKTYGIEIQDGPMANLHSRAVIIINPDGKISYSEQVPEIANEPDYEKALAAIQ